MHKKKRKKEERSYFLTNVIHRGHCIIEDKNIRRNTNSHCVNVHLSRLDLLRSIVYFYYRETIFHEQQQKFRRKIIIL